MKRPYKYSETDKSGPGYRITYYDREDQPVVSLWGMNPMRIYQEGEAYVEKQATGRPHQ